MKLTAGIGALIVAVTLATPPALAQQASPQTGGEGVRLQARSLIGSTVRAQDGKDIGKVSDLMIDKDGKVTSAAQVGRDRQSLVVIMDPAQLPQAPAKQNDRGRGGQQQHDKKQQ